MMTNLSCSLGGSYSWLGNALNQLDPFQCPLAHGDHNSVAMPLSDVKAHVAGGETWSAHVMLAEIALLCTGL